MQRINLNNFIFSSALDAPWAADWSMKEDGPSSVQERFDAAVRVIRTIPSSKCNNAQWLTIVIKVTVCIRCTGSFQPSREMTLRFYGLFKQATEGPISAPKPGFYEVEKSAKWLVFGWNRFAGSRLTLSICDRHAWKVEEDLSKEVAMDQYVQELKKVSRH